MFERPDFKDPRFAEHVWYFDAYKDALLPFCRGLVLDIGAGHGYLSRAIAEKPEVTKVIATDRHYDADRAQRHAKMHLLQVPTEDLVRAGLWRGIDRKKFDTIVATEHVEHLPESLHVTLLEYVSSHLEAGGLFLGSMPEVRNSGNPFHLREYLAAEWKTVLERYFSSVEIWFPNPLLYCWKASRKA